MSQEQEEKLNELLISMNRLLDKIDANDRKEEEAPTVKERLRALEVKVNILAFIGGAVLIAIIGLLMTHVA